MQQLPPILVYILGALNNLLRFISCVFVFAFMVSFIGVFVCDITIKINASVQPYKKSQNNNKRKKSAFGNAATLSLKEKIVKANKLHKLQKLSKPLFCDSNKTYIRVQRTNVSDDKKKEEILKWSENNTISIPFTLDGREGIVSAYLNDEGEAVLKISEENTKVMILNSPRGIQYPNKNGSTTLVMVITWIGDVYSD